MSKEKSRQINHHHFPDATFKISSSGSLSEARFSGDPLSKWHADDSSPATVITRSSGGDARPDGDKGYSFWLVDPMILQEIYISCFFFYHQTECANDSFNRYQSRKKHYSSRKEGLPEFSITTHNHWI